jgi:hypothetical protein
MPKIRSMVANSARHMHIHVEHSFGNCQPSASVRRDPSRRAQAFCLAALWTLPLAIRPLHVRQLHVRALCVLVLLNFTLASAAVAVDDQAIPKDAEASTKISPPGSSSGHTLHGKAEVTTTKELSNLRAWQASQLYKRGVAALDSRDVRLAADCFKNASFGFEQPGFEKFEAQTKFAEAQARRLLGQAKESGRLYQAAIDLFNEYDPLSPYLKAALDNLAKVSPGLKGKVEHDKAKLRALVIPTRIMTVDRNVVLKGGLSKYGSKLLAEKALIDVPSSYLNEVLHKAFIRMTCLETADLGSNYYTYQNRWYPLIASGKTVALAASSDFLAPSVQVKINARQYNVGIELPGLGNSKRTVFLLTDGNHIIAIDPATEDMWHLDYDFKQEPAKFSWRKLTHFKPKRKD